MNPTIDQLKGIISEATEGPWIDKGKYHGDERVVNPHKENVIWLDNNGACGDPECCGPASYYIEISESDMQFIAAARTALPAALELISEMAEALTFYGCDDNATLKKRASNILEKYQAFKEGKY